MFVTTGLHHYMYFELARKFEMTVQDRAQIFLVKIARMSRVVFTISSVFICVHLWIKSYLSVVRVQTLPQV